MDKDEEKALKDIEKNGCHIIHIPEGEDHATFTYSIGMMKSRNRPDVIITGLDRDTSHFLINEYNYRIKDGEIFEADKFYDEFLEGFRVTFKAVDKKHYPDYFGWASWLYEGDNFEMLHLIWPDTCGAWPWEKKATKEYRSLMPPLYTR